MGFWVFLTKTASNEDSKLLPRFLTLWTNSKKLSYSGTRLGICPGCGRSQTRQRPETLHRIRMDFAEAVAVPSTSSGQASSRAYSPAEWLTVLCG
ncbi:MAG: hypothetical protein PHH59_04830 [Methylovulum sp.]|nr:hypothetical protein [Methylovulum sp.]